MSFLDLPPEIRNMVYERLFPKGDSAAQLLVKHSDGYLQMSDRFTLLETCRLIYQELSSLLRSQRRFVLMPCTSLFELMDYNHEEIEARILRYSLPKSGIQIRYDLDHCTLSSEGIYLTRISQEFSIRVLDYATIRSTTVVSTTGDFRRLRQWVLTDRNQIEQTIHFVLRFAHPAGDDSGVSLVDGVELLGAVFNMIRHSSVQVESDDMEETSSVDDFHFIRIAERILLFVHTLIRAYPGGMCAKIWLGKHLQVTFAELRLQDGTVEHVSNKRAEYSWDLTIEYLLAGDIIRHYHNRDDVQASASPNEPFGTRTLLEVAKALARVLHAEGYE